MAKKIKAVWVNEFKVDLLMEKDAGNEIRFLMGEGLAKWRSLKNLCDEALGGRKTFGITWASLQPGLSGGFDLSMERDSGNRILVLMDGTNHKRNWSRLRKVSEDVITTMGI